MRGTYWLDHFDPDCIHKVESQGVEGNFRYYVTTLPADDMAIQRGESVKPHRIYLDKLPTNEDDAFFLLHYLMSNLQSYTGKLLTRSDYWVARDVEIYDKVTASLKAADILSRVLHPNYTGNGTFLRAVYSKLLDELDNEETGYWRGRVLGLAFTREFVQLVQPLEISAIKYWAFWE